MTKVETTAAAVVKRAKTGGRKEGTPNRSKVDGAPLPQDFVSPLKSQSPFPAYKLVRVDQLVPYATNARTHSPEQLRKIEASIREFGFTNPVLTDGKKGIVAGHGRVLAAQQLGMDVVPSIELSHLTAAQRRAYVLADNRLAEEAGWDEELLASELGELSDLGFDLSLTGFNERELVQFMAGSGEGLTDPDDAPEVEAVAVSTPGNVWLLGDHRLVCGDCTDAAVVARALAGAAADLVVTSPPYNQFLDKFKPSGMQRESGWVKRVSGAYGDSLPEPEYQDWQRDLLAIWFDVLRDHGAVFYNHKHRYRDKRVVSPLDWLPGPFNFRQEIIWRRPGSITQNARMFLPIDERIYWLYKGDDFTFANTTAIKTWSSVWDINPGSDFHAVGFPVELPKRCIEAASKPDDHILEPFSGSGTTIIAAEMTGRIAHAIEIEPRYVDVAVRRWQAFTGKSATLEATGATFDAIAADRLAA